MAETRSTKPADAERSVTHHVGDVVRWQGTYALVVATGPLRISPLPAYQVAPADVEGA